MTKIGACQIQERHRFIKDCSDCKYESRETSGDGCSKPAREAWLGRLRNGQTGESFLGGANRVCDT